MNIISPHYIINITDALLTCHTLRWLLSLYYASLLSFHLLRFYLCFTPLVTSRRYWFHAISAIDIAAPLVIDAFRFHIFHWCRYDIIDAESAIISPFHYLLLIWCFHYFRAIYFVIISWARYFCIFAMTFHYRWCALLFDDTSAVMLLEGGYFAMIFHFVTLATLMPMPFYARLSFATPPLYAICWCRASLAADDICRQDAAADAMPFMLFRLERDCFHISCWHAMLRADTPRATILLRQRYCAICRYFALIITLIIAAARCHFIDAPFRYAIIFFSPFHIITRIIYYFVIDILLPFLWCFILMSMPWVDRCRVAAGERCSRCLIRRHYDVYCILSFLCCHFAAAADYADAMPYATLMRHSVITMLSRLQRYSLCPFWLCLIFSSFHFVRRHITSSLRWAAAATPALFSALHYVFLYSMATYADARASPSLLLHYDDAIMPRHYFIMSHHLHDTLRYIDATLLIIAAVIDVLLRSMPLPLMPLPCCWAALRHWCWCMLMRYAEMPPIFRCALSIIFITLRRLSLRVIYADYYFRRFLNIFAIIFFAMLMPIAPTFLTIFRCW